MEVIQVILDRNDCNATMYCVYQIFTLLKGLWVVLYLSLRYIPVKCGVGVAPVQSSLQWPHLRFLCQPLYQPP